MIVTLEEILEELKKIKPEKVRSIGWEYTGYISLDFGLNKEGFTQEIALGDIDETETSFSWNSNSFDNIEISGDLPKKETAEEMARDFLAIIEAEFILAGLCEVCGACGNFFAFTHECDLQIEGEMNQKTRDELHLAIMEDVSNVISKHLPNFDNNIEPETWGFLVLFIEETIYQLTEKKVCDICQSEKNLLTRSTKSNLRNDWAGVDFWAEICANCWEIQKATR